jgi:tellurite methyltransferase
VRHKPPFWTREWTQTAEGRASRIGAELNCVRCDQFELPAGFAPYKRTAELDEGSVPAGLLADHTTRRGVWAVIHVVAGSLTYIVEPPLAREQTVGAGGTAIVVPEVRHRVRPEGSVRFFVEFHRRAG